jgi:hypothetical protein
MADIEKTRKASYAKLGLTAPKRGGGVVAEGVRVSEHPIAVGGFGGSLNPNSEARRVKPVEVVDLGIHIQATGKAARELTGDPSAEVVVYGRNPQRRKAELTITRSTVDGGRQQESIDLSNMRTENALRDSVRESLEELLRAPRKPFTSDPAVDLRNTGIFPVRPRLNGRVQARELALVR